ncbi:MAG: hypothetical protein A2Z17_01955 [Gammaproteobacteria bacterium RBG_16_66_13]|nr:MAG: hypothetical protein A2Z17_01955 [Gammaproteobacteria bacterium RBG_16_66_13]
MSEAWRFLHRSPTALLGAGLVTVAVLVAVVGPIAAGRPPEQVSLSVLEPPSERHLLGTDWLGRDVLSRVVVGARVSLLVSILAVVIGASTGTGVGLAAGMGGKWADELTMRMMDVLLAFPPILLAIVIVAFLGPSLYNAMIAIGLVHLPIFARITRARVLDLRRAEFLEAAVALGASPVRQILRHLLPNMTGTIIIQATASLAYAILTEATLGFLGLGAQPPTPTWGSMLSDARSYLSSAPWLSIFPGLAILLTVIGFNLLGDALSDYLDPRLRHL